MSVQLQADAWGIAIGKGSRQQVAESRTSNSWELESKIREKQTGERAKQNLLRRSLPGKREIWYEQKVTNSGTEQQPSGTFKMSGLFEQGPMKSPSSRFLELLVWKA